MVEMRTQVLVSVVMIALLREPAGSQGIAGRLELTARVTPTGGQPEPVRGFTFYVLTKSYAEIVREMEDRAKPPSREKFIDELQLSPELREWLHNHNVMDITLPGFDKLLTAEDVLNVPEFMLAYMRWNSGGVTNGIPKPKYRDVDKTKNPARYEKQQQEYLTSLKNFIQMHPATMAGMELELDGVNPARKWAEAQTAQQKRVGRDAPIEAQTKFLAAKVDTDSEGRAGISGLPVGAYWITSLGLDAVSGDTRLKWDLPVTIQAGRTIVLELTNLNAEYASSAKTH